LSKAPETIVWLVTSKCNLNCRHCYAKEYLGEEDLDTASALRVVREAAEAGVKHIHYTGGEPLLRRDIKEVLKETLELGVQATLFTNSTLVTRDLARELSNLGILVYTSIDGPSREVHEALRGPGTWGRLVKGLKALVGEGVEVHANISVAETNWAYVGDTIAKALELGASSVSIIPTMPAGNALRYGTHVTPSHFAKAVARAARAAEELGVTVGVWCAPFTGAVTRSPNLEWSNCRDRDVMDLSPSGRVLTCDVMNYSVGNVLELGVRGAWEALRRDPVMVRASKPRLKPPCTTCPLRSLCRGGCYARAWLAYGDVEAPDPLCPRVARAVKRGEKLFTHQPRSIR